MCVQVLALRFLHNYLSKPPTIGQFANSVLLHCPVACPLEHSQESPCSTTTVTQGCELAPVAINTSDYVILQPTMNE